MKEARLTGSEEASLVPLRDVVVVPVLFKLQPFIRAGLVHLVPDPGEVSAALGQHVREVLTHRTAGWKPPKGGLHRLLKLGEEEHRRFIWMLPEASQRHYIAKHMPEADAAMIDRVIAYFKRQAEADPYALLQPLPVGDAGAQFQIYKGTPFKVFLPGPV